MQLEELKTLQITPRTILAFLPLMIGTGVLRGHTLNRTLKLTFFSDALIAFAGLFIGSTILICSEKLENVYNNISKETSIFGFSTLLLILVAAFGNFTDFAINTALDSILLLIIVAVAEVMLLIIFRKDLLDWKFLAPTIAHYFDASTTVRALQKGAEELNPLVIFTNTFFGDYSIFIVKTILIVPVALYLMDEKIEYSEILILLITSLGVAIGTGNLFS